jgi:hypothetical protein
MYSETQIKCMALEVARAGRCLPHAVKALREEYETFRKVSARTLRRFMQRPEFVALVEQKERAFDEGFRQEVRRCAVEARESLFRKEPAPDGKALPVRAYSFTCARRRKEAAAQDGKPACAARI